MISRRLVEGVQDEASLLALLQTSEVNGGLGWPVSGEFAFEETPEIAQGVKGEAKARVSRLIPSGTEGEWLILLAEFDQDFKRRDLREILRSLRAYARETAKFPDHTGYGDTLFIVANPGYQEVRFVLFQQQEGRQARIRLFGWSAGELGRTLLEHNLPKLRWSQLANWAKAWDVEALTKQFFREISDLFYDAVEAIKPQCADESEARLTVQTLFNRLLFLRFVEEKKGWLQYGDEPHYLQALWKAGEQSETPLWPTRLAALFAALNHPSGEAATVAAQPLIGKVPFLNGGLFEQELSSALAIPKSTLDGLIGDNGLFYRYNFVVEESTPLDVELAIDPEMLGKIFEQLTNSSQRHDTGSYYTPREIVQFMCREALVGYLVTKGLSESKARMLVFEHDDSELTNQEGTLAFNSLKEIKVVDPACGSGAYLLGMLQELYALFEKLRRDDRRFSDDPASEAHGRKLWIIENNIYGVDIQAFATNTAMLRLWLTLLVEDTGTSPQPLPNLEYKIETGDALLGPDPSQPIDLDLVSHGDTTGGLDFDGRMDTVDALRKLREEYQNAHSQSKASIKTELESKLAELREKVIGKREKDPAKFDWRVEFFDVFLEHPGKRMPGFDVALANPPYIKYQLLKPIRHLLKEKFVDTYDGEADLLVYFFDQALSLLTNAGAIAFITSNQWLKAEYGRGLRSKLGGQTNVQILIDYDDRPVFEAIAYPLVLIAKKGATGPTVLVDAFALENWEDSPQDLVSRYGRLLPKGATSSETWFLGRRLSFSDFLKMCRSGPELSIYLADAGIGHIRVGLNTGCNDAFYVDTTLAAGLADEDEATRKLLFPLAKGGDIVKWLPPRTSSYVIALKDGPAELEAHAALDHMSHFRERLTKRTSRGRHWYQLRACAYYNAFEGPGIVFPDIAPEPRFTLSYGGTYLDYTAFVIPCADLYLLGVLNSHPSFLLLSEIAATIRGGYLRFKRQYVERIPIPRASHADQGAIAALVQGCLNNKATDPNADVRELEAEIDARVEFLYFHRGELGTRPNVAGEEVPYPDTYDEWVALREAEAGTIVAKIRQLIAEGESGTVEFKQSLEFVDPDSFSHVPEAHRKQKMAELQKEVLHAALKTICAFANTKGGTLLIGVHDSGDLWGLDGDFELSGGKRDQDAFENRLTDFIKTRICPLLTELEIAVVKVDGKWVCRVHVPAAKAPHYLDNRLYIRLGNSTEELAGRDLEDWLANR